MIWIIPLVLAAAAVYSLVWFLLNKKLPHSEESENMTSKALAIMSRSLFKRRGFLTGMTYTGQSKHLNHNGEISPLNRSAEESQPEIPEEKPEQAAAPVNPPAENPEPGNPPEEKDDPQDGEKPTE